MNVIFVPGNRNGHGRTASLNGRYVAVISFAIVLVLPMLVGVAAYRISEMASRDHDSPTLAAYRTELTRSRSVLRQAREESVRHLNALALRLGSLQAQVVRLNALGTRLTTMAGLDAHEFSFDTAPAMGGPEKSVLAASVNPSDVTRSLDLLAHELDRSQSRLVALESLMLDRKVSAAVTPSAWPVDGSWISSGFGRRMDPFTGHQSMHEGVDFAARFGGPIYATGDGVINLAGDKSGYGLAVEIIHESGLMTRYGHASEVLVKVGDRVAKGQLIARVGSTGRSTGPHLHFEVLRNGQAVNPAPFLSHAQASRARTIAATVKTAVSR